MSCSMMYKKITILLLIIFLFFTQPLCVIAKEERSLPKGEVLIIYSDDASKEQIENVSRIVEILTYEGVRTTFAPAFECAGKLDGYDSIILYELETYPSELTEEIWKGEGNRSLLFVGNSFLKKYLDDTLRSASYTCYDGEIGTVVYEFEMQKPKQSLAALKEPVFLEKYEYEAGKVFIGSVEKYFCARQGRITHISVSDLSNPLILSAFTRELSFWRKGNEEEYARYYVFDKVYPFQNPGKLLEAVNEMKERNVFFIISVMPVYNHEDYPAMQQFCEVLKYAQDNGGMIFLHAPINQMNNFDVDLVNEYLSLAVNAYMKQGVYPMGLQVPGNWIRNSDTVEVMSRFKTILVSEEMDGQIEEDWIRANGNLVYQNDHQWIAPAITIDQEGNSYISVYSTAVYLNIDEDMEQIRQKIDDSQNFSLPSKDLWEISHSFYTNTDTMIYKDGQISINGIPVDKTYMPVEPETDFSYKRNQLQRFSRDLTNENNKLLIAVIVIALLFVIFIIVARRNNRSRFFYEDEEDMDEYWENKR